MWSNQCWQSKDFLQVGLAGSWGKDAVRLVHLGVFSTSHFTPTALSFDWILNIVVSMWLPTRCPNWPPFKYLNIITDLPEGEEKTLQTDGPLKEVIIFRGNQNHDLFDSNTSTNSNRVVLRAFSIACNVTALQSVVMWPSRDACPSITRQVNWEKGARAHV